MDAMIEAQTISAIQNYLKEYNTGKNEENNPIADLQFVVWKDLEQFSKIFVSSEFDSFRNIHCLEKWYPSFYYVIYRELPDGDKNLLFTCTKYNQFSNVVILVHLLFDFDNIFVAILWL